MAVRRELELLILLPYRSGYYVGKNISLESKIARSKGLYYDALEASQHGRQEGTEDPVPFIKYLLSVILEVYRDFDTAGGREQAGEVYQS